MLRVSETMKKQWKQNGNHLKIWYSGYGFQGFGIKFSRLGDLGFGACGFSVYGSPPNVFGPDLRA